MDRRSFLKAVMVLPVAKYLLHKAKGHPWDDIISSSKTEVGPWMGYVSRVRTWDWPVSAFDGINDYVDIYSPEDIRQLLEDCDCEFKPVTSYRDKVMEYKPFLYAELGEPGVYINGVLKHQEV